MSVQSRRLAGLAPLSSRRSLIAQLLARLALQRSRRALARLDRNALADIGLTPAQAQNEANRRLWDAPDHWLR